MFFKDRDASTLNQQSIEAALTQERDPEKLFSLGLSCYRQKKLPEAKRLFMRASEYKQDEPRFSSYYGLLLALVDRNMKYAVQLCQAAVKPGAGSDLLYNLGRVYQMQGQREKALKAFQRGLTIDGGNMDIHRELENMGTRRKPVFSFLPRGNFINRFAGKIRNKVSKHTEPKSYNPTRLVR